jgi:hypothetical protein
MTDNPLVSVIIPTHNRGDLTIAAIRSVLDQSYRPLEMIVVDDGSSDGSKERVEAFIRNQSVSGVRIHFIAQETQGPSKARNTGISAANGQYIAFLDSDDLWLPEKLQEQVDTLKQFNSAAACFTDAFHACATGQDESTLELHGRHYPDLAGIDRDATSWLAKKFCGFFISTLLVSADLVRQLEGFDPEIPYAEDRDFYFRLSLITPLAYLNKQLVRMDRNPSPPGSTSRPWDQAEVRLRGHQRMYEKWLGMGNLLPAPIRQIVLERLRATHCDWVNLHLENRRYSNARREVSQAIKYCMTPKMCVKWGLVWAMPALAARLSGRPAPYL